jgi:hypothetical protein
MTVHEPDGFRDVFGQERRLVARHQERYEAVQALLSEDCSLAEICRRLGLSRDAVRRFARATSIEEVLVKATNRAGVLGRPCCDRHQRLRPMIPAS